MPARGLTGRAGEASTARDAVDFRYYSLDSWIGAIGLPDDPTKCVVDADGTFMTEMGRSSNRWGVFPLLPYQSPVKIRSGLSGGGRD